MCGIVGLTIGTENVESPLKGRLSAMCQAIFHRGPDDTGIFVDGEVGLGMRRLSIIDVEGGHQPLQNEPGHVTVVFNGEIYNYKTLRHDLQQQGHRFRTRRIRKLLSTHTNNTGVDCVQRFNGIFAFALWDAPARRLFLARDRIGVKPLYYTQQNTRIAFASRSKLY